MNGFNGCILSADERDFILGGDININDLPDITTSTYEYNQLERKNEFGYCLCTIYAPIGVISDNCNRVLTDKQRKELVIQRYNLPDFDRNVGGLLSEGINITRKYYKSLGYKVSSLRINTKTDLFKVLDKDYRVNIGMIVKDDFIEDSQKDGVLNKIPKGNSKYGHSTSIKKIKDSYIVDNYKGTHSYNRIQINDLQGLIDDGIIYEHAYILFLDKSDIILNYKTKIMDNIKLESARKAVELGLSNGERPNDMITREESMSMNYRLYEKIMEEINKLFQK